MKQLINTLATMLLVFSANTLSQSHLKPLESFGDNPGELTASVYLANDSKNTVVLLHGCSQNAQQLAKNSGFLALAEQYQFNLLLPQQSDKNNIKTCFNWFSKKDMSKDSGELLSLKNMILTIKQQTDSDKVYVAGLSAGGAMTSALLSIYPELFTAGAIIAGIAYPCADTLTKAIACMRTGPSQSPKQLADAVLNEHPNHNIHWPRLSIWTGSADKIVNPKNAKFIAEQWLQLKLKSNKFKTQARVINNHRYKKTSWHNAFGQVAIELYEVNDLDHGIMVNPDQENGGTQGAFLLPSTLSSAISIVEFWQLKQK